MRKSTCAAKAGPLVVNAGAAALASTRCIAHRGSGSYHHLFTPMKPGPLDVSGVNERPAASIYALPRARVPSLTRSGHERASPGPQGRGSTPLSPRSGRRVVQRRGAVRSEETPSSSHRRESARGGTPREAQVLERLGERHVVDQRGELAVEQRLVAGSRPAWRRAAGAPRGLTVHGGRVVGDVLEVAVGAEQQRGALLAEAGQARDAVGGVAGRAPRKSGMLAGPKPRCARNAASSVTLRWRRSTCTTRSPTMHCPEVLVGREDAHLVDLSRGSGARRWRARRRPRACSSTTRPRRARAPPPPRCRTARAARAARPRRSCSRRTGRCGTSGWGCRRRPRGGSPPRPDRGAARAARRRRRPSPWRPSPPARRGPGRGE